MAEPLDRVFANRMGQDQRLGSYAPQLTALWLRWRDRVDPAGRRALRTMTWAQVRELERAGMEIARTRYTT